MKPSFYSIKLCLLASAFFIVNDIFSQVTPPETEWQKCVGGMYSDGYSSFGSNVVAPSVYPTADGGYIAAGTSYSNEFDVSGNHGNGDYWVVKFTAEGYIQWQKCFGGSGEDVATSIQQTADGNYIIAGYTGSNDGDVTGNHAEYYYDYWIIKLDASGNIQWQKCLGGSGEDYATSIRQTADGGYIVAGASYSTDGDVTGLHGEYSEDYWIVKLDASGNIQWQKCLGGSTSDRAFSIQPTTDGGYIVAGFTSSNDGDVSGNHKEFSADYWIVKLDASGNIQWQKCLGGWMEDAAGSIQQTADEGYIVAGYSISNDGDVSGNHGSYDYWIVKLKADIAGTLWYRDADSDGYGDPAITQTAVSQPPGYVAGNTDCNDNDNTVYPGAPELVDGKDNDCDGLTDEVPWYRDADGDGYGNPEVLQISVSQPEGYVANNTDCNDGDNTIYPGAPEIPDGRDNDCDGVTDNGNYGAPVIEWQKTLGGNGYDKATAIQQTTDGGYIVTGISTSGDGDVSGHHGLILFYFDCWIAKLDASANIQWQKSLGGSLNEGDIFGSVYSVQQTTDGGYIVAGSSTSADGDVAGHHQGEDGNSNSDYWLIKLDATGNTQWQKSLGGSLDDHAFSVQQTTDGGYIVAGNSNSTDGDITGHHGDDEGALNDQWLIKLGPAGALQWQRSLGGSFTDEAYSVQQTSDGGYIAAGYSNSADDDALGNTGDSYWIVKVDNTGALQWKRFFGGSGMDKAYCIRQTHDNGYIVAGASTSTDGDASGNRGGSDYWVVKLDNDGSLQWQRSLGGSQDDVAYSVWPTTDGGYVIAGRSQSTDGDVTGNHGGGDCWIVMLDNDGELQWQKTLGGSKDDAGYAIQQTADGAFIIAGWSASADGDLTLNRGGVYDYWVVKLAYQALPVQLVSFGGVLNNGVATLTWQSGSEDRFGQYELEKSPDGSAFIPIASIAGKGSNSSYSHAAPQRESIAYYRLKMVDADSKISYSDIIALRQNTGNKMITLYPNPARDMITVKAVQKCNAIICNAAGMAVKKIALLPGVNRIDVSGLSGGIYFLFTGDQRLSFIKQ